MGKIALEATVNAVGETAFGDVPLIIDPTFIINFNMGFEFLYISDSFKKLLI